jgi:hypothetical protein
MSESRGAIQHRSLGIRLLEHSRPPHI